MKNNMPNIPNLRFSDDSAPKQMMSLRLPAPLIKELKSVAKKKGWSLSQLLQVVMDVYCQSESEKKK